MNFGQSISYCLSNYTNFEGRGSRPEYWWFVLFVYLLQFIGVVWDSVTGFPFMFWIVYIAFFIPSLSAGARRLHDIGKSGWWQLLTITIIGIIPLLIWLATEGTKENNSYGKSLNTRKQPYSN